MKKRICIVASYAPSLINFRRELIESFVLKGYDVIALAPDHDAVVEGTLKEMGVRYVRYSMQRTGMNPLRDLLTLKELFFLFKKEKPDIVMSYTVKPVLYASIAAKISGVKYVYSMITGLGFSFVGNGWRKFIVSGVVSCLFRLAMGFCTKVFFQNPDDKDLFISKGLVESGKQVLINGSGVNTKYFSEVPLPHSPRFLMIARLLVEKGVAEYVEAATEVRKRYPNIQFDLVGWIDSSPSAIKQEQLNRWVASGAINFLGRQDDIRSAMKASSVFVLPSYREGTPRTVLEAMAMGRAIITTDVAGCRETVVHNKNGFLVQAKKVNELAEKMEYLICNEDRIITMGKESRKIAEDKYEVSKVNSTILSAME